MQIISGFMLTLYAMCGLAFVAFADATFRSTAGPVVNELRSPRFLRGVHLGLNLSGMLLPMPLFSLVGIPITLYRIRAMRQQNTGVAVYVFGVLTFVAMFAFTLLVIVGASMPTAEIRRDDNATTRAKVEMGCFRQPSSTEPEMAAPFPVDNCPEFAIVRPIRWLALNAIVLASYIVPFVLNIAFVALADRIILREIAPPGKVVQTCTHCKSRIQFISKGSQTLCLVKCHKCGELDHYS